MKTFSLSLWAVFVFFLCGGMLLTPTASYAQQSGKPVVDKAYTALPNDLKLAFAAALNHIRRLENAEGLSWPVQVESNVKTVLKDAVGGLENFAVSRLLVTEYAEVEGSPGLFNTKAKVMLSDPFKRRYGFELALQYFFPPKGMTIFKAKVSPLPNRNPEFEIFTVPAKAFNGILDKAGNDYDTFMTSVLKAAVDPIATQTQNLIAVVQSVDRLPPGDIALAMLGGGPTDTQGFVTGQFTVDFSGWPMVLMPIKLNRQRIEPLVFKVVHHSPMLRKKSYVATSIVLPPNMTAIVMPETSTSSTRLMLNNPGHVGQVQQRLKDLGFFKGSVDGKWGKSSRLALREFKAMNGLENSFIWDDETQEVLFP